MKKEIRNKQERKMINNFMKWSFISNVAISAEGVLGIHSMLNYNIASSLDNSSLLTTNYIGKDIIGQVGGLYYIHKTGKHIDKEPRKFLIKSHLLQQSGISLEYLSGIIELPFLPVLGIASILKNISCDTKKSKEPIK